MNLHPFSCNGKIAIFLKPSHDVRILNVRTWLQNYIFYFKYNHFLVEKIMNGGG